MASNTAEVVPPSGEERLAFKLQIISPSLAVGNRLTFDDLPANTTVRELKGKIRDALDAKPIDQTQRLIHRGRLLARDTETLLDVFGEETLRDTEPKVLHLVLRDISDGPTPASGQASTPSQNQPRGVPPGQAQQHHPPHMLHQHPFPPQPQARPAAPSPHFMYGPQPPMGGTPPAAPTGNSPFGYNPQQFAQQQRQWAATMHDHQRLHELISQNQRGRAAMGLNGVQDNQAANPRGTSGNHTPGRTASPLPPDGTRTVVRQGVGPNGEQWRFSETISTPAGFQRNPRTGSPFSAADLQSLFRPPNGVAPPRSVPFTGGQPSAADVQNVIRAAEGQAATRAMTDALRRNASSSSLVNLANSQATQPIPPGVTTPLVPSRTASATGTPDPAGAAGHITNMLPGQPQAQTSTGFPEVYILSSPEGPRALLVHGNLGAYFTPRIPQMQFLNPGLNHQMQLPQLSFTGGNFAASQLPLAQHPHRSPLADNAAHQNHQHQRPEAQAAIPQGLPQLPQVPPRPRQAAAPAGNAQAGANAGLQIWTHLWLVIRLLLFVLWFTWDGASWQRWFTVLAVAVTIFLINTGLLNPLGDQVWVPVRRHLENIMPLADNHGRAAPARANTAQGGNANTADQGHQREPNPADTAARLVQERRHANTNWLMNQVRRLERAGILFLASIAPGVAERHIANLEAADRAERQRREAEAAAAEVARAAVNEEGAEGAVNEADSTDAPANIEPAREGGDVAVPPA
ncbi:ubiquitin family protein [Xylariales sp. AK1849]|nr:ubiquitin family protein [Xylariales sp. AK1849]